MARRYTELFITINTNHKPKTAAEEKYLKEGLREFIEDEMNDAGVWGDIVDTQPAFDVIDVVQVDAVGIETAPRTGFIHAHLTVIIEHHGKLKIQRHAQRSIQNAVNARLHVNGSYVEVQLRGAQLLNYVAKTSGTAGELASIGIQPSVEFGDDDGDEV